MATPTAPGAENFLPTDADLDGLRAAAATCQGCQLYRRATQTVFGDGDPAARVMLVGEVPGDREDRAGEPFVGPAGGLLARALGEAGIDRSRVYLTNVVKHFKFTERGKRRIHQTPNQTEIVACRPWLLAEVRLIEPDVLVCLGATAAKALLGSSFRVSRQRGELLPAPALPGAPWEDGSGPQVVATIHPSAVLRSDDRAEMLAGLVADLAVAAHVLS